MMNIKITKAIFFIALILIGSFFIYSGAKHKQTAYQMHETKLDYFTAKQCAFGDTMMNCDTIEQIYHYEKEAARYNDSMKIEIENYYK